MIGASEKDIRNLAELVEAALAQENLCVIGNEEKILDQKDLFETTEPLF